MGDKEENTKKPLKEWLQEFYDDTTTLSGLIRNLAFAGIGVIWIFRNPNLTLPKSLLTPLNLIICGLIADVVQYIWRATTIYIEYKIKDVKHTKGKLTDEDISDVQIHDFIPIVTWIFFVIKIITIVTAYFYIYEYISVRI
ncbi:MAG TPA: hypothetical protein VK718_07835 [Ferruginibacter sp.]|jgi:hypothetical protein|nr:hypothetical protein [Ferruginibacter sp.]